MATSLTLLKTLKSLKTWKPLQGLSEWHASNMGYRQMGLRFDDLIPDENPIAEEALSRLSTREYYDRLFRIRRALHLSMAKDTLPEKEWVSAAEDVPYLRPILDQVEHEVATRQNFDTMSKIPEALLKRNRV